jgi:surface polysaccharide O-acyltransferase-like enzyme
MLKGIAILSVLLQHTVDRSVIAALISSTFLTFPAIHPIDAIVNLSVDQAVPIFLILIGWNLHVINAKSYIPKRLRRILIPFIPIFMISLIFGMWRGNYYIGPETLLFRLPVSGPGNYFVPLLIGIALLSPLLAAIYNRSPVALLALTFVSNLAFNTFYHGPYSGISTKKRLG